MASEAFTTSNERTFSNPLARREDSALNSTEKRSSSSSRSQRQQFHNDNGLILKLPSFLIETDLQRYEPGDALTYGLAYLQKPIPLEQHIPNGHQDLEKYEHKSGNQFLH